jgi:argininosuccinate lyase
MSKKSALEPERLGQGIADELLKSYVIPQAEPTQRRIFNALIQINEAHLVMVKEERIVCLEECRKILSAILEIEKQGVDKFKFDPALGDLYMNMESYVIEKIGEDIGGKMHTGRSRNDLFQTALHFALARKILEVQGGILKLEEVILNLAKSHVETIMPGYTHTQHAQPITYGHYLVAFFDAVNRDLARLNSAFQRVNLNPLGAAALAGTGFPINRHRTSELLGFGGLLENTLDAVSEKDDVTEVLSDFAILATNLSRAANDLVYWGSMEFGMIELADQYCTSSSIMPQKKNPWSAEMVRAYSGDVIGNLMKVLSILKGLPIGFNMDIWVILENAAWDSADLTDYMVRIMTGILASLEVNVDVMERLAPEGFSTVTELADAMVRSKGISFRTAHRIVGLLVRNAIHEGLGFADITSAMLDESSLEIAGKKIGLSDGEIRNALDPRTNVQARNTLGGPAPDEVKKMIAQRTRNLAISKATLSEAENRFDEASKKLQDAVLTTNRSP